MGDGTISDDAEADADAEPGLAPARGPSLGVDVELPTELIREDEPATVVSGDGRPALPPRPPRPARFRRVGTLGVGGMGEVHEFEDRVIGRRIALKTLRRDATPRRRLEQALEREARITGRLEHPNVVPVYDAGHDPRRGPFYTMRIVREPTLHDANQKARAEPTAEMAGDAARFTLGRLLRVFVQICRAVGYAHTKGVVHCDLKPSNVLLGAFGEIFVVDWGLAHADDEPSSQWGGTPGYMAPEQVEPEPGTIGPRADVFALGAILYEILVLSPAFFRPDLDLMVLRVRSGRPAYDPPRPPIERAPERVPEELSELCMRALRFDPAERVASCGELADELELFLEGTKEKERRRARAETSTAQGESLTESYEELLSSRPSRTLEIAELRRSIPTWAGADQKSALWDAEDRNEVLESLSIRTLQAAVAAFEHALDEVPNHAPARRGLARLFRGEAQRARARGDALARVYFEGLLSQYDDAEPGFGREASLRLHVAPEPDAMVLERHGERDRRLQLEAELPVSLGRAITGLDPGHYVLRVERERSRPVRVPILLRAGDAHDLHVRLDDAEQVLDDERFVAAGPALLGGHESSLHGADLIAVDVPAFAIATLPVTFAQYRAFLEALRALDEDEALRRVPRSDDGSAYLAWRDGAFVPTTALRALGVESDQVPVFGVSALDALAYARWRSSTTGRAYRLPAEDEWEKAARGVDGRTFPWGDRFDASFCKMRASRPGVPRPEPIGAFEADASPYGVRDVAGSLACWTAPMPDGTVAARGGAWCDFGSDCHLGARRVYAATERSMRVGIRLAR